MLVPPVIVMWAALFGVLAVVIFIATTVILLLVLIHTEITTTKPENQTGYKSAFLPFYILALLSGFMSFYLYVLLVLQDAFGAGIVAVLWMVLPFFILALYLYRHRHGSSATSPAFLDNSNECTHRVWISEDDTRKIADVEHLAEHTCTSCGSLMNLITLKGVQSPEGEPWRIFCVNCGQEVDVDQL